MLNTIKNVAIIMDGNGRWAKSKGRPRVWGHIRGTKVVREIVTEASKLNLNSLTLYAFSTENWSRPTNEVSTLFKILKKFLRRERDLILKNKIRFRVIGNYKVLDSEIVSLIEDLQEETKEAEGLNLNLAINYGGRSEIIDAVNSFMKSNEAREMTEEDLSAHLYNPELRDIDVLIRTAGDVRISNFLLWQISYAELYFSPYKWPDFSAEEFRKIVEDAGSRERRFGRITPQIENPLLTGKANKDTIN